MALLLKWQIPARSPAFLSKELSFVGSDSSATLPLLFQNWSSGFKASSLGAPGPVQGDGGTWGSPWEEAALPEHSHRRQPRPCDRFELLKSESKIKNKWAVQGTFSIPQTTQKQPPTAYYLIFTWQKQKISSFMMLQVHIFLQWYHLVCTYRYICLQDLIWEKW